MSESVPIAELPTVRVVYLGHRTLSTGKVGEAWTTEARFNERAADGEGRVARVDDINASLFDAKRGSRYIVGGIYEAAAQVGEDGGLNRLGLGRAKYVERIEDATMLAALQAADQAADQRKRQADLEKRLVDSFVIDQELTELRRVYLKTPPADRTAFELMVLKRLRNAK